MRRVGIKLLKNRLSEYVRAAEAGETVLVTDRDKVVAELVPPRRSGPRPLSVVIEEGVREGWYTPAKRRFAEPLPLREGGIPFDQLMADLAADREDR